MTEVNFSVSFSFSFSCFAVSEELGLEAAFCRSDQYLIS